MSTLSVRFPDSVHEAVRSYAKEDDISINQFVISAVIEKLTAFDTANYIESRAAGGSREKFLNVLKKAPHVCPKEEDDRICTE